MITLSGFLLAVIGAAAAWIAWGAVTFDWLHDMGPGEAIRKTFSLTFWRTGE